MEEGFIMHILFVDDNPYEKVDSLICYLHEQSVEFSYDVIGDSDSAIRYLEEHENAIDLAVIDLGLPKSGDRSGYHVLRGLDVVDEICNKYPKIPVIINSTTYLPAEKLKPYAEKGLILKHCKPLYSQRLIRFTEKGNIHLIEPNIGWSGIFVFWVDTDDNALVERYANQLEKSIEMLREGFPDIEAEVTISSNKITLVSKHHFLDFMIRHTGSDGIELFKDYDENED